MRKNFLFIFLFSIAFIGKTQHKLCVSPFLISTGSLIHNKVDREFIYAKYPITLSRGIGIFFDYSIKKRWRFMYGFSFQEHRQRWEVAASGGFSTKGQIRLGLSKNIFLIRYDMVQNDFCNIFISAGPILSFLTREKGAIPNYYVMDFTPIPGNQPFYINQVDAGSAYKTIQPEVTFLLGFEYKPNNSLSPFINLNGYASLFDIEKKDFYYFNPSGNAGYKVFEFNGPNRGATRNYGLGFLVGVRCKLK